MIINIVGLITFPEYDAHNPRWLATVKEEIIYADKLLGTNHGLLILVFLTGVLKLISLLIVPSMRPEKRAVSPHSTAHTFMLTSASCGCGYHLASQGL